MADTTLSVDRLYAETCTGIRATDDISFKLMGFVPLISGAALLTFFLKDPIPPAKASLVMTLALFAALITLGLFRWELRNILNCKWLARRAAALERALVRTSGAPTQPAPPFGIGKTEAEKAIYSITILAWLIMPMVLVQPLESRFLAVYAAAGALIAIFTAVSAFESVEVPEPAAHAATPAIHELMRRWRRAIVEEDVSQLLPLMAEDVVFLSAGQPTLRGREAFETHLRAALKTVRLEPTADVQEVAVAGDFAYCWNEVVLNVTPRDAAPPMQLVGTDLTILRKEPDGRWVVCRAASTLLPQHRPG